MIQYAGRYDQEKETRQGPNRLKAMGLREQPYLTSLRAHGNTPFGESGYRQMLTLVCRSIVFG
jgi:hypothetical protein